MAIPLRPLRGALLLCSLPLLLLLVVAVPTSAPAHQSTSAPVRLEPAAPGSAEANLHREETEALGAEHAAAHAYQREFAAREQAGPERAAPPPLPPVAPQIGGAWSAPTPLPVIAINAIMLPTGKVLMFAYPGRPGQPGSGYENRAKAYLWDPVTKTPETVDPPLDPRTGKPTNIWCAGASLLSDGRVLITGGNLDDDPANVFTGLNTVFIFDPWTKTWQRGQPLRQGRWYPTQTLMPDGRTLVVSGLTAPGDPDFASGAGGSGGVNNDAEIVSTDGTATTALGDMRFNGAGRPPLSALYPHMFWMRSGRALAAGPERGDSWLLTPGGAGGASSWADLPNLARERGWSTAVMLDDGRVMTLGGSPADVFSDGPDTDALDDFSYRPATATTEIFDENDAAAGWKPGTPMELARSHANSVLLPDRTVATVGGGFGEDGSQEHYRWLYDDRQRRVELLDPYTGTTVLGAAQAEARTYHSTALLLPDARVMSAGDDINGAGGAGTGITDDTAEIYSPPYLFKKDGSGPAARPQIASLPATATLGNDIEIATTGVAATKAVLIAPGAATHANDMSQRIVPLEAPVALGQGALRLRIPSNANAVLPGYYMLFVLSDSGVPSIARFIRIQAPVPVPVPVPVVPQPPDPQTPAPEPIVEQPATAKGRLVVTGKLPSLAVLRRTKRFTVTVQLTQPGRVSLSALLERPRGRTAVLAPARTLRFTRGMSRKLTFVLTRTGRRLIGGGGRRFVIRVRAQAVLDGGTRLPVLNTRRTLR